MLEPQASEADHGRPARSVSTYQGFRGGSCTRGWTVDQSHDDRARLVLYTRATLARSASGRVRYKLRVVPRCPLASAG